MELSQIIISKSVLLQNISYYRKLAPQSLFMAVVKSNAYGHGLELVVEACAHVVDYWGVNSFFEAKKVRKWDTIKPILILGGSGYYDLPKPQQLIDEKIEFTIASQDALKSWLDRGYGSVPIHLKIDSGMGRLGIRYTDWQQLCSWILENKKKIFIRGIMTHFSNIEDAPQTEFAKVQFARYQNCIKIFYECGLATQHKRPLQHCCSSAGAMRYSQAHLDLIRIGAGMYGLPLPDVVTAALGIKEQPCSPVLQQWTGLIVHQQYIPKGHTVGYENSFTASEDMRIGILALGYYEGFSRVFSNQAQVLLANGKFTKVLGKISMNMIAIDLTIHDEIHNGQSAVLLGQDLPQRKGRICVRDLAELSNTIPREIVSRLSPDIAREMID